MQRSSLARQGVVTYKRYHGFGSGGYYGSGYDSGSVHIRSEL